MTAVEANVLSKLESLGSLILLLQLYKAFSGLVSYIFSLVSDKETVEIILFGYAYGYIAAGDTIWMQPSFGVYVVLNSGTGFKLYHKAKHLSRNFSNNGPTLVAAGSEQWYWITQMVVHLTVQIILQ